MPSTWTIRQDIADSDVSEANRKALDAIDRGADAVGFNALEVTTHRQIGRLLAGIDLDRTEIHFTHSRSYPLTLELFLYELNHREISGEKVRGSLNFDFISYMLLHGDYYISRDNNLEEAIYLLNTALKRVPGFRVINVNGHYFQDAGATLVQELAFTLASGNEYLALLTSKGMEVDDIALRMSFSFAIGSNYFMEIAKLRAARLLWYRITSQYHPSDPDSGKMQIHTRTALWNKTLFDPYVNLLRTTTEGMSAVLGNADSLTILPFDSTYAIPGEFSERVARNQQLIMREESYLDKETDPAGGAYYIENLTHSLAKNAWDLFLRIEEQGGMTECIRSGLVQDMVERSAREKEEDLASRRSVLLGTNQYPNLHEQMLGKITNGPKAQGENTASEPFKPLKPFRISGKFEQLRLDTERFTAAGNKRPGVFLFPFGNLAMQRARAGFATNFFGCAGYEIFDHNGFSDPQEGIRAWKESGTGIIVLCSSDEEYPALVPLICDGIRATGSPAIVVVAGYPKDSVDLLKAAGVDEFIHLRSNLLEMLTAFQDRLGIPLSAQMNKKPGKGTPVSPVTKPASER